MHATENHLPKAYAYSRWFFVYFAVMLGKHGFIQRVLQSSQTLCGFRMACGSKAFLTRCIRAICSGGSDCLR